MSELICDSGFSYFVRIGIYLQQIEEKKGWFKGKAHLGCGWRESTHISHSAVPFFIFNFMCQGIHPHHISHYSFTPTRDPAGQEAIYQTFPAPACGGHGLHSLLAGWYLTRAPIEHQFGFVQHETSSWIKQSVVVGRNSIWILSVHVRRKRQVISFSLKAFVRLNSHSFWFRRVDLMKIEKSWKHSDRQCVKKKEIPGEAVAHLQPHSATAVDSTYSPPRRGIWALADPPKVRHFIVFLFGSWRKSENLTIALKLCTWHLLSSHASRRWFRLSIFNDEINFILYPVHLSELKSYQVSGLRSLVFIGDAVTASWSVTHQI